VILPIAWDDPKLAALMRDPYIARVGHDHRACEPIDNECVHYYGAYLFGSFMGAFCAIESGHVDWDVHAYLRRGALSMSRELGIEFLDKLFDEQPISRVTAQIIQGLETAVNYCKRLGFEYEGYKRNACQKDGALVGVHILGLTKGKHYELRR